MQEIRSGKVAVGPDDEAVRGVIKALHAAARAALDRLGLEGEARDMALAVSMTAFVWEMGAADPRMSVSVISALITMAVDAGLADDIGLRIDDGPGGTVQ